MATPQALFTQEAEPRFTSESVGRLSRLGRIMPAAIPYGHAVACRIASVSVFIIPLAHTRNRNVIRRATILPAVFSCLLGAGFGQAPPSAPEKVTLIRAATLIDGASAQVRHNVPATIRGNKIENVSQDGNPPAGATVINLAP